MSYRALSTQEGIRTGRRRYRRNWLGKIILQLEFEVIEHGVFQTWIDAFATVSRGETKIIGTYWRDAAWTEAGLTLWTVSSTFRNTCPQASVTDKWHLLTELRRYRRSMWGGKAVLQVEGVVMETCSLDGPGHLHPKGIKWRDAVDTDVNLAEDGHQIILRLGMPGSEILEYNDKDFKED